MPNMLEAKQLTLEKNTCHIDARPSVTGASRQRDIGVAVQGAKVIRFMKNSKVQLE